jgi:hypothetical protein
MRGDARNRATRPELPWPVEMLSPLALLPARRVGVMEWWNKRKGFFSDALASRKTHGDR